MQQLNSDSKFYSLSSDEPILGFTREGKEVSFHEGDQLAVQPTSHPRPGSLVLIHNEGQIQLRRFEKIDGVERFFPPTPSFSLEKVLGEVTDHFRASKWLMAI